MASGSETCDRPNIVLVNCHDLGTHLGCYGWDVETPHVDAMADDGVQFDNAFCTSPICAPSRSSIATGEYPHQHGMMGLAHLGWALDDEGAALPWRLNDADYGTHLFGYQHETDWSHPERLGYRHVHRADDGHGHPPARALDVADRFVASLGDLAGDRPFYANLGFVEPHRPLRRDYVPDEAFRRYDPEDLDPLPYLDLAGEDLAEHRRDLADFWGLVTATVDPAVGRVREGLRERGLAEETVVIFTTDHGEPFDRAKGTCYDPGMAVACLVEAPDAPSGERRSELVSNVDLFSTVLDYADAPVPGEVEGRSFRPLLAGGDYEPRERVYCEQNWGVGLSPSRSVRTDRYKLVRHFRPAAERRPGYGDGAPTRAFFDLEADPHERSNLHDPDDGVPARYEDPYATLRDALHDWMVETGDPLAGGCLPMPKADRIDGTVEYPDHYAP